MTEQSNQKIALITGGNRGLGRAGALALAADGTDVIITYRGHADEAEAVVKELDALGRTATALQLDTTELDTFPDFTHRLRAAVSEHWGRDTIDFLVNNAGSSAAAPFVQTSVEQFDLMIDVHVKGPYFLTQTLLPVIADGGRIINFSSGLARFVGGPFSAYGPAKGAVEVWTRYLASELAPRGIAVNVIAPGPIATDFGGGVMLDEKYQEMVGGRTAFGRIGRPEEIGGVLAALLAPGTNWVTGQRIEVSGGTLL